MRKQVKLWLTQLEAHAPRVRESMLAAMMNVRPSQLLDHKLWQTLGLEVATEADSAREPRATTVTRSLRLPIV
jgi:hypothetical protein